MALNTTLSIVDYLKSQGQPSDYGYRSSKYKELGLESKYGSYVGSGQQNTGMLNLLQSQKTQIVQPTQPTAQQPTLESVAKGITDLQNRINTEGITSSPASATQQNVSYREGDTRINPTTGQKEMFDPTGNWVSVTPTSQPTGQEKPAEWQQTGMLPHEIEATGKATVEEKTGNVIPTASTPITEAAKVNATTPNVQMPTTDITSIINEITTGTLTTPEGVIAGEKRTLLEETQKASAAKALTTMQQNLAKSGMTFSGIRTEAEAQLAAESLAKMSGIALDAASDIISAARKEQTRREQALEAVQEAQNSALKSMGYVINPYTGTLEKTLEREKFEEPAATKTFTSGGNIFQYDPATGSLVTLYEAPEANKNYQYFTDNEGNVTRYDPNTGETENLGPLAKGTSETLTERDRAIKIASFAKARPELEKSKGTDGYINADLFMRLRADYADLIGNADDFDDVFAPMLNPKDRLRLGVGKTTL